MRTVSSLIRLCSDKVWTVTHSSHNLSLFTHATLAGAGISCRRVCLSVRLYVTSRCSTETAERSITETTPHDSQRLRFSVANDLDKTQTGSPVTANGGARCRWARLNAGAVAEN